jgi:hypothetical protein
MRTSIILENNEIKTAILEYVKNRYNITLDFDSINISQNPSDGKQIVISASIKTNKEDKHNG